MSRIRGPADRRAIAATEFALLAPVMLLLLLGATDLVTWMRTWLRVSQAASEVGQVIGQFTQLHEGYFTSTFYPIAQNIAGNAIIKCDSSHPANGSVVISGITTAGGKSTVTWQRGCVSPIVSQIGQQTKPATLPAGYVPPDGTSIIVVEVSVTQPAFVLSKASMFMNGGGPSAIRSYEVVTTRNGILPPVQP